jgi:hypothetical protein
MSIIKNMQYHWKKSQKYGLILFIHRISPRFDRLHPLKPLRSKYLQFEPFYLSFVPYFYIIFNIFIQPKAIYAEKVENIR